MLMQIKYSNDAELKKAQTDLIDNNRFYDILQEANLRLGQSICSSQYKYSVIPERLIIRFYYSYLIWYMEHSGNSIAMFPLFANQVIK